MVYKFRPLSSEKDWERLRQIISQCVLYMGPAAWLNDPTEGRVELRGTPDSVERFYQTIEKLRRDACVLSFSEALTEPLMWAHYAQGFQGIALEFDTTLCDWMSELYPVEYRDSVPIIDTDGVGETDLGDSLIDAVLLTKSGGWFYERELRYAQRLSDRKGPCNFILAKFPGVALRTIVIGCRTSLYDRERLVELVNKLLPHVTFGFATPAGRSIYGVTIHPSLPAPSEEERLHRDLRNLSKLGINRVMIESGNPQDGG